MKLTPIAQTCMWLPGFAPEETEPKTAIDVITPPPLLAPQMTPVPPVHRTAHPVVNVWPRVTSTLFDGLNTDVAKYNANVCAINMLTQLQAEKRSPTQAERDILLKYTGWGGLPQVFDAKNQAWANRYTTLQGLLSQSAYDSARASTPCAHYTPVGAIEAIWEMIRRLGFTGGKILDPCTGTGLFIGCMPQDIAQHSQVTAIELDETSAAITSALYEQYGVTVLKGGYEAQRCPADLFDLVIGNVPFGEFKVPELRNVPYAQFSIHNYFLAKSMEVVRPGGLVAILTSTSFLDGWSSPRNFIAAQGALEFALRLPNGTFKDMAGTDAACDLLIFRKYEAGESPVSGDWVDTATKNLPMRYSQTPLTVNAMIARSSNSVIGTLEARSGRYGAELNVKFAGDVAAEMHARLSDVPSGIYKPRVDHQDVSAHSNDVLTLEDADEYASGLRVINGHLYQVDGNKATPASLKGSAADRALALCGVRDAARQLINAQPHTDDDDILSRYRLALNVSYDQFVAKFGAISLPANRRAFSSDSDLPLLLALELWDDETKTAQKAEIFLRRTVRTVKRVERCDTAIDALQVCLVETGRIVPKRLEQLLQRNVDEVLNELEGEGAVYLNPVTGYWESAEEYLSGNVRTKLECAMLAGKRFEKNVDALKIVMPADLGASEIRVGMGATWIPASVYAEFLDLVTDTKNSGVSFCRVSATWDVRTSHSASRTVKSTQVYGTEKCDAVALFKHALNQTTPKIAYRDINGKEIVNQDETVAAREKLQELKTTFQNWVWADKTRETTLTRLYNEQFNSTVQRKYDGSKLPLPGYSWVVKLDSHQLNAIWRQMTSGGNTLLAHVVGAGKSLTMICAGMEMRRIGKAQKPLYVVPNHMLEQFSAEFLRAYPNAKLLLASKDDLESSKRQMMLARIASGNWDGIVMTHSSFKSIDAGDAFTKKFLEDMQATVIGALSTDRNGRDRSVKELEKMKRDLSSKLMVLASRAGKDKLLAFEDLGIDHLHVDEAHLFKNLWRVTKMDRIAGLPNSKAERAFDMFIKTRCVMDIRGNESGVVFATGTPISNSMAELYTMQRYLQPLALEERGMAMFDAWAANFGSAITALELSPEGLTYRMQTRFAKFVNLPELMAIFREVADIQTQEMLNLPVPKRIQRTVTAKSSPALKKYMKTLVERAKRVRMRQVSPSDDNMLKITSDGRKVALDMRLCEADQDDDPGSKVNLCVQEVYRIWQKSATSRGTQLVFCDLSTPRNDGKHSVYADMREKWINLGIPSNEIAFIHDYDSDAQKEQLFRSVRSGAVRILMGSTEKMGMGTNVQTRLMAIHHVDGVWRPADVEQRDGRGIRRGNINAEVEILVYVTEGSFDAYIWQLLESKARFIAQVMRGDTALREIEDLELMALSYAEVKALASGDPKVLEKAGVDAELAKLSAVHAIWKSQQWTNKHELASIPEHIKSLQADLQIYEAQADWLNASKGRPSIIVDGVKYSSIAEAAKPLFHLLRRGDEMDNVGQIGPYSFNLKHLSWDGQMAVTFHGGRFPRVPSARSIDELAMRLHESIHSSSANVESCQARLANLERRCEDLQKELAKPFAKADRLNWLERRSAELEREFEIGQSTHEATNDDEVAPAMAA